MSSTCGIPIPVSQSGTAEICGSSATLSSSHKRVGSCSQASLYVPEAKRPQLSSPTNDNWPQGSGANFTLDDSEEVEDGNIASTDSYIEELLDIIQSGDEASPPFKSGSNGTDSTSSSPPLLFHLHTEEANLPTPLPADTASTNLLKLSQLLPDAGGGNKHELFELGHSNGGEVVVLDIDDYYDDMMGIVLLKSLPTSIDDLAMSEAEAASVLDRRSGQVERTDIALERLSFDDEDSLAAKSLLDSRPFDEDDLEVAMINESFEEQQKQSLAYECGALESFFLSEATTSVEGDGKQDHSEASTSPSANSETDEASTSEEDTDEPCHVSPKSSEFIPVLTPKSRSFVKGHPTGHASTSSNPHLGKTIVPHVDYDTPTVVQPTSGKPLRRHVDDDERSRRLNEKLEMMMLAGQNETTPAGLGIQVDRQRGGMVQIQTGARADSGEKEVSSTTILDECADAAEAIAHGVVASLFSSPVVFAEKSPPEERERPPSANVEQLYACEDEETDFVEAKLLSQSLLRDLSVLSEEESPTKDHLKSEIGTCLGSKSLYAGSGAHNSSSTNSSSSAICVLAETKLEADEQKVPIVD